MSDIELMNEIADNDRREVEQIVACEQAESEAFYDKIDEIAKGIMDLSKDWNIPIKMVYHMIDDRIADIKQADNLYLESH